MRPAYGWLMFPLLAACAAGAPQWDRPGAAQATIEEDTHKCRMDARMVPGLRVAGPGPMTSSEPLADRGQERDAQDAQEVRRCMEGKGYRVKR